MYRTEGKDYKIIVVGLVGFLGSWREAIATFLHYSFGFMKINFTDKVKEVAKVLGTSDLRSLQVIKHVIRESLGQDLWLRLLERRLHEEMISRLIEAYSIPGVDEVKPVLRAVVGDIAYRNEFDFIRGKKGLLIGLRASEKNLYERAKEKMETGASFKEFRHLLRHPSVRNVPTLIEECDFIVDTDTLSLSRVEERVDEVVRGYFVSELFMS